MTKESDRDFAADEVSDPGDSSREGDASHSGDAAEPKRRRKMGMRVPSDCVPRPDRSQPEMPALTDPMPGAVVAPSAVASAF